MPQQDNALYLTQQIRTCERLAIDDLGLREDELMARAGHAAWECVKQEFSGVRYLAVFCGGGNNAGDGYVLAELAHQEGYFVRVFQNQSHKSLPPAAKEAAQRAEKAGVPFFPLGEAPGDKTELIIDALLGIGIKGEVYGEIAEAINLINACEVPVLSLDVPSGLDADTGRVCGLAVVADVTVTFIGHKVGQLTLDGPDHCGTLFCDSLQLERCLAKVSPAAYRLVERQFMGLLPPRPKNAHKGLFGHVLIIGGGPGMPGAPYLAALAALRVGAGAVTVATHPENVTGVFPGFPEVMVYPVHDAQGLHSLLASATVCVIGPGLGEGGWASPLFSLAVASQLPLVIDASALRLLAKSPQHDDEWIVTPHPGEAAALLGETTDAVESSRLQAVLRIQQQYGGNVVLKGVGSLIASSDATCSLCTAGNPGMATAGMGDVLSGILAGLVAQGVSLPEATKLGVWLHAKAGDDAVAIHGERGLVASDIVPFVRQRLNSLGYAP